MTRCYGRADTDGPTLHADITSGATSMQVDTTTSGSPAVDHRRPATSRSTSSIAGEQITVTSISGSSSPQTFTITSSVNGVVKAHTAGAAVRLFIPPVGRSPRSTDATHLPE